MLRRERDYENVIISILNGKHVRESASFWWENASRGVVIQKNAAFRPRNIA